MKKIGRHINYDDLNIGYGNRNVHQIM